MIRTIEVIHKIAHLIQRLIGHPIHLLQLINGLPYIGMFSDLLRQLRLKVLLLPRPRIGAVFLREVEEEVAGVELVGAGEFGVDGGGVEFGDVDEDLGLGGHGHVLPGGQREGGLGGGQREWGERLEDAHQVGLRGLDCPGLGGWYRLILVLFT